eukprot:TRINITY_DN222_c0_g3_i1.p2 TRINITY_DN222_c0_g3~~TRINITY_DN222_c0_g3_i1.p2  ORF type:complete len:184 (+),score=72.29 TRINITY_DN222_c0_g3_i1:88-639(+)
MAAPTTQTMTMLTMIKGQLEGKFPTFAVVSGPDYRRWACFCSHCSCCHTPKDEQGERQCCSGGVQSKCLWCSNQGMCTCLNCNETTKACCNGDSTNGCCDQRPKDGMEICYGAGGSICCCCYQSQQACICNSKDGSTCCKLRRWCMCFYDACALPCDEDVPCELGVCGCMCINKATGGTEPAA